jgi:excisionase family DNA binding protein
MPYSSRSRRPGAALNAEASGKDDLGCAIPEQAPYWDLDLLTPDDVCALLKVKRSWLYDTVETGALEAIRLGKQLRFRPSALIRYLDERASIGNDTCR